MKERDVESFIFNSSPRKKRSQPDLGDKNKECKEEYKQSVVFFFSEGNASKTGPRVNRDPSKLSTNKAGADTFAVAVQNTHNFMRSSHQKHSR